MRHDAVAIMEMVVEGNEEARITISSRWPHLVDASDHVKKGICDASGGLCSFKRVDEKSWTRLSPENEFKAIQIETILLTPELGNASSIPLRFQHDGLRYPFLIRL